jgi:hypothetical protein
MAKKQQVTMNKEGDEATDANESGGRTNPDGGFHGPGAVFHSGARRAKIENIDR